MLIRLIAAVPGRWMDSVALFGMGTCIGFSVAASRCWGVLW